MKGTLTITYHDQHRQEKDLQGIGAIWIKVNDIEYRIKTYSNEGGITINVENRLVLYPQASNAIHIKGEDYGT